jgi:hypothetical protein
MANVAIISKYDKKWTIQDFEKLRDDLINNKLTDVEYHHAGNKKTESEYVSALAILEGLLEVTEPIKLKPFIAIGTDTGEVNIRKSMYRKLEGKVIDIEFKEKIYHDFYYVEGARMTLLNKVKDPRSVSQLSTLNFPYGRAVLVDIGSVDDAILLLQTYKRAVLSNSFFVRTTQYKS